MEYLDYEKESDLKGHANSIDINKMEIIIKQMRKCICKIKCSINGHGSGFFCKIPFPNEFKLLPVLVTNNHVLGENDIKEGKKITFSINNNDKDNFEIIIDKTIKTYTNKEKYDITFIEIKSIDKIKRIHF